MPGRPVALDVQSLREGGRGPLKQQRPLIERQSPAALLQLAHRNPASSMRDTQEMEVTA